MGNALLDLLHAPLHLRAREVPITVVHCPEFAAIDRNAGSSEQSHAAQSATNRALTRRIARPLSFRKSAIVL
jgi:hypothetical protein